MGGGEGVGEGSGWEEWGGGEVANVAALFERSLFPSCSLLDAL